jgi:formylmethanofuran dehydrogenase subunit E
MTSENTGYILSLDAMQILGVCHWGNKGVSLYNLGDVAVL